MNYNAVIQDIRFQNFIDNLESTLYSNGDYEISSIDAGAGIVLTILPNKNPEYMPTIQAVGKADADEYIWWECLMSFPELSDQKYYDNIEHWVKEWARPAKICTYLQQEALVLDEYDWEE